MKYVVSTSNENHFFGTLSKAQEDFSDGLQALGEVGIKDTILLYEIPENTNDNVSDQKHFISCLENESAILLKQEEVK